MENLKLLIVDLLNHIDNHKEGYNKEQWTNENIVNTWLKSHDHLFKPLLQNIQLKELDEKWTKYTKLYMAYDEGNYDSNYYLYLGKASAYGEIIDNIKKIN